MKEVIVVKDIKLIVGKNGGSLGRGHITLHFEPKRPTEPAQHPQYNPESSS